MAGKLDWLSNELPVEGKLAETVTVGMLADRNVPTCRPTERLSEVRGRPSETRWKARVVINDARVVLGLLSDDVQEDEDPTVDRIMELGPTTFRPYISAEQMADYVQGKGLDTILITTSDGRLVGALTEADLRRKS